MNQLPYSDAAIARRLGVHGADRRTPVALGHGPLRGLTRAVDALGTPAQYAIAALLVVIVVLLDALTDPELSFSIFYALPVALLAWNRGWTAARISMVAATVAWFFADIVSGPTYSHIGIRYWNGLVRFSFFLIVGYTVSELRRALNEAQRLARTDNLTGVANSRSFLEAAAGEVVRQQRYGHPLSLAFIDCDNFKQVNDQFGHAAGDDLLRTIADAIQSSLRGVDTVARLGGDEFAMLLPESDVDAAATVWLKVRESLGAAVGDLDVTFSVGLVTYRSAPASVEELVHSADEAMYEAKKTGKNASRHRIVEAMTTQSRHVQ